MRFRDPKRLRIVSGATLLLLLAGVPVLLGLTRPAPGHHAETPELVKIYASGLTSMGWGGWTALGLAALFALWLLIGQRQHVNRRYLSRSARNFHNLVETLRSLAIIFGAAAIILGSLAGLYAAMVSARPDLLAYLPYPLITFPIAVTSMFVGAALYTVGRIGR